MDLSDKIKILRNKLELTLDEVAAKVGVSASTIMRYEKGQITNLKRDKIKSLADALETTPAYLMGWTDDPTDYDTLNDVWVPDEYKKLGVGVKEYLAFKKAEDEDALKEQWVYADDYTEHEKKVISAYRNQPDMQPAVDKILGVEPELFSIAKVARGQKELKLTKEQMKEFAESAKKAPNRSQDKDLF